VTRPSTFLGWIVLVSLRFRFIVVALAITMMVIGTLQIPNMRVDAFPELLLRELRSRRPASACRPLTSRHL